jgi:hypothetical protein
MELLIPESNTIPLLELFADLECCAAGLEPDEVVDHLELLHGIGIQICKSTNLTLYQSARPTLIYGVHFSIAQHNYIFMLCESAKLTP